ncbi:MAG: tyrosine--tRNA ligase, partial [Smithellaceae bacterium]|nr:tyrosine--tRNA ligase [Smithellaceae bacterium]
MENLYQVLSERGFVEQVTDETLLRDLLAAGPVTGYIGFDPTAASLHIGHLVPIMGLAHMFRAGHRPIALVGGGTGLIGDPSGKTEMRQVLTREQIDYNATCLRAQLSRYIDFSPGKAILLNNADWLTRLNYIEFLRDIGRHFSVNRMLAAESYRSRLEKGLNFIEFNYMLLQAYDFLHLCRTEGCLFQLGGNDQWGNMLAGVDLIRREEGVMAHCLTFPLLTTASGQKMGKTEKGAVWLDASQTTGYDYYQYWVNTEDADVQKFLALFTFLPMDEVRQTGELRDQGLNMAKTVLAYEATRITHGEETARAAWRASAEAFGSRPVSPGLYPSSSIPREEAAADISSLPTLIMSRGELTAGIVAYELFFQGGLCASKGEAKR